jgi:hypothetical protein
MNPIVTLAQDVAISPSNTLGLGALVIAAVTAVWTWFRSELNDCKKDRKDLFGRVDQLQDKIATLSERVGNVERKS